MNTISTIRALGLCSGGLDSMLSALILKEQGAEVEWISFETPFFSSARAVDAARELQIPLTVRDITDVYLDMLKNPSVGYGKNMNPCMDCHRLMFHLAGRVMTEKGFSFMFSGEVLGQRPMSQTRSALRYVEKHSGYDGYILRPLSARRLPETIPEKEGWVKRDLLLGLAGRSRKPQIALAEKYGITRFPPPAGGCLLTDKGFSRRLKDLFDHQTVISRNDYELLKHGRHIRLNPNAKIIVGRTREDNQRIIDRSDRDRDVIIRMKEIPGPIVMMPGGGKKDEIILAASICAGYAKAPNSRPVSVCVETSREKEIVTVVAVPPRDISRLLI
ncbi:MAG: tRNA 4-thiouridine(8) synthase ThiI [Desulfobacterales bacterium]